MKKPVLTKYDLNVKPRFADIYKWVREGLTDEQIAERLDIHVWTLGDYKKKYPELAKVLNKPNRWETNVQPRLKEIQKWCEEGITNDVICKRLDIAESTWYEYLKEHPVLAELVKLGKSVMDSQVENSLLKAALGYDYEEIKTIIEEDKNGKKKTRIEKVKRHQPPNPTAMIFWLKNRAPEQWNDRREIIIDTKAQEEERKRLFLEMIQDEVVDLEYNASDESYQLDNGLSQEEDTEA